MTSPTQTASNPNTAILNYIFAHARGDERPYLRVTIYGCDFIGLLDSGASRTIMGKPGWDRLEKLCRLETSNNSKCTVANGSTCAVLGQISLPIKLRTKVKIIKVLIVPDLPQSLILGIDFWTQMEIIPDLHGGEWSFRSDISLANQNIAGIHSTEDLPEEQRQALNKVVENAFRKMGDQLGCTHLVEHEIKTSSAPIKQRYYPLSPAMQKIVDAELDDMIAKDIVEVSNSPWSSPVVMVRKSDNSWRFCVNFKRVNAVSEPDAYPLPYPSAILDQLKDAKYLSTLDIKSAYWQIPVAERSRPITAFTVPNRGLYQFKRLPFGLHSAPATWQRLIDRIIRGELEKYCFAYLDDLIICTPDFETHLQVLEQIFQRLIEAGLTVNKEKCVFCRSELRYLGYVVNSSGLMVDPQKVEAILTIPTPRTVTEVRRIVGLASWYRRFVPSFSSLISPLTRLTEKNRPFIWDQECDQALNQIKEHLVSAPILACPDFSLPFIVETDASDFGLGAILSQKQEDGEKVICYLSRSLTKAERKYTTTEKELLAVLFAVEKLRPYLEMTKFTVITDHYSLKWLFNIKSPSGRIARWALRLQQYDFDVIHRKGKDHLVPDALSRSVPIVETVAAQEPQIADKWYIALRQKVTQSSEKYPLWRVETDKLYRKTKLKYPSLKGTEWLEVVPRERRIEVIRNHHDIPTSGHLGITKTTARITSQYYWPKLRADVAKYVNRCSICLQTKPEQKAPIGQMLSKQPTTSRPWELVSTDIVGPLPRSTSGYSYILSVMDCFSKFVLLFPLRQATASTIVKWLEDHVILIYGAPKKIIVDNGAQFKSFLFRNLMKNYNISINYTANYHPQANPVERVHRVVKTMLASYVSGNQKQWDKYLAKVAFAIRSAEHEVTGVTPNLVNFGREVSVNGNASLPHQNHSFRERKEDLEKLFKDIRERLARAYERSRHTYNLRHRNEKFSVNQLVWKRNYAISDASKNITSKLAAKFTGPYKVIKILSPWSYELEDENHRSLGVWNAKDIKSHPPDLPINGDS